MDFKLNNKDEPFKWDHSVDQIKSRIVTCVCGSSVYKVVEENSEGRSPGVYNFKRTPSGQIELLEIHLCEKQDY